MTLTEAIDHFENLLFKTDKKSEIKTYQAFIGILSDLSERDLTDMELQSIEAELERLQLKVKPENEKKYFRKKLATFKEYLKNEHSFISEGYYTGMGIALGMAFGLSLGLPFSRENGMIFGMMIGMILGIIIGSQMDEQAKKQNRVLKTNI